MQSVSVPSFSNLSFCFGQSFVNSRLWTQKVVDNIIDKTDFRANRLLVNMLMCEDVQTSTFSIAFIQITCRMDQYLDIKESL